jgi:phosphatidylserine/phosphatidylglycerophosphate/cardiolipin synthase-like enzyme
VRLLSSNRVRFGLLIVLGLLIFLGVNAWKRSSALSPLLGALPQDSQIQVYFNHSQAAVYTEPYRKQTRLGDDLEQIIVDTINAAQTSIDVAVQELHLPRVADALRERHQAGVAVRVIVEHDYNHHWSSITPQNVAQSEERDRNKYNEFRQLADKNRDGQITPTEAQQADSLAILESAKIPLIDDTADGSKGSGLMHHKFVIVDQQIVLAGSVNYSISEVHGDFLSSASTGNANHLLKITSPALAQIFLQEFNLMWGDGPGGNLDSKFGLQKPYRLPQTVNLAAGSSISVQFSPTSSSYSWDYSVNGLIGRALNTAAKTIDLALFVFSEQNLSNILETVHLRGVQLRALIEPEFLYRNYSEGLDMMGVTLADNRCRYETNNKPWSQAIATVGSPQLAEGDILHHKFGVVDNHLVITGSQNWSAAANYSNDENLLTIENRTVTAHFQREFDRLYTGATLGTPEWLQTKIQQQQSKCHV